MQKPSSRPATPLQNLASHVKWFLAPSHRFARQHLPTAEWTTRAYCVARTCWHLAWYAGYMTATSHSPRTCSAQSSQRSPTLPRQTSRCCVRDMTWVTTHTHQSHTHTVLKATARKRKAVTWTSMETKLQPTDLLPLPKRQVCSCSLVHTP